MIEFDQRFFNDGYTEFQLMISDIRKQCRLNEEVLTLKKKLEQLYGEVQNDNKAQHSEMSMNTEDREALKEEYLKQKEEEIQELKLTIEEKRALIFEAKDEAEERLSNIEM